MRANYDKPHGAMDAREAMVEAEYLMKARKADEGMDNGANYDNSDSDLEGEVGNPANNSPDPAHLPGPVETKLRAHPSPVGLCFGTYGEGSQGVHDLVDIIANKLAEERGDELGVDKDKVLARDVQTKDSLHFRGGGGEGQGCGEGSKEAPGGLYYSTGEQATRRQLQSTQLP